MSLQLRTEFEQVLQNYTPDPAVGAVLKKTKVALLMGLSASGRNTIIEALLKTGEYHFIISDTTRAPRINRGVPEQNGVEYWFKTEEEMLTGLQQGEYIEAAIIHDQQVSGVSIKEIQRAQNAGQIAITDIQQEGIDAFCALDSNIKAIFMLPPSYEVWLERLNLRGKLDDGEFIRRRNSALSEIDHLLTHDYKIVINDNLEAALHATREIVEEGRYLKEDHSRGLALARSIQQKIKNA